MCLSMLHDISPGILKQELMAHNTFLAHAGLYVAMQSGSMTLWPDGAYIAFDRCSIYACCRVPLLSALETPYCLKFR